MSLKLWSDEDRLFIPRALGWSVNFKYIARKLGWIKPAPINGEAESLDPADEALETSEDRLRRSIDRSRFEDR
ncbi:hypothetical protein ACFLSZ_01950 [Candidatus Bipolaricaulota bacterium]